MEEIVNLIWGWLQKGYDYATDSAKSIWNETMVIFKMAMEALGSIISKFQLFVSYSQKTSWREEGGLRAEVC